MLLRTRELIDTQAIDIKKAWKKEQLKQYKSWNSYHLTVWSSGCSFNGFLRNYLQSFTDGCEKLGEWMDKKLPGTTEFKSLSKAFKLWGKITKFLKQLVVKEEDAPTFNQCID